MTGPVGSRRCECAHRQLCHGRVDGVEGSGGTGKCFADCGCEAFQLPRCACDEGCVCDPRIGRAMALVRKSFDKSRSESERAEFRTEAWEILSHIFNA